MKDPYYFFELTYITAPELHDFLCPMQQSEGPVIT